MLVALLVVSSIIGRPPQVQSALETLTACQDLRAEPCLFAAAWLKMGGDEAMPEVLKSAPGMTQTGQLLTISAIGTVNTKAATETLGKLAQDTRLDEMARALALEQLSARTQTPKMKVGPLEVALSLVGDGVAIVRQAALRLIANRVTAKDKKLILVLLEAWLRDDDGGVRSEAVMGFSLCGCSEAPTILGKALRDNDPRVRRATVEGLALVKHPPAVPDLVGMMNTRDVTLNRTLARALRFQSGKSFGDDAEPWKSWLAENR